MPTHCCCWTQNSPRASSLHNGKPILQQPCVSAMEIRQHLRKSIHKFEIDYNETFLATVHVAEAHQPLLQSVAVEESSGLDSLCQASVSTTLHGKYRPCRPQFSNDYCEDQKVLKENPLTLVCLRRAEMEIIKVSWN